MKNSIHSNLIELIDCEIKKSKNKWNNTDLFYNIKTLSIDQRGRIGEHFLLDIFKKLNMNVKYVDNSHGDWDIEVNDFKIEIKTATLDVNNKFQHEGIKESKMWDIIAFLDISPNEIYITFINKNDFEFGLLEQTKNFNDIKEKVRIYGTFKLNDKEQNCHFRGKDNTKDRATGAGYKVDFKINDLKIASTIDDIRELFNKSIKKHHI